MVTPLVRRDGPLATVDLTMPIESGMPVFPGNAPVSVVRRSDFDDGGGLEHAFSMGAHSGTHIDAPAHMFPGGRMLDEYDVATFFGPGRLIDARGGIDTQSSAVDDICPGEIVLLWTGLSDRCDTLDYYNQVPLLDVSDIARIVRQRPKLVGVDAGSIDASPFDLHKAILGAGILLAENLVNLASLDGHRFEVCALPLRLQVEAAPARIVAQTYE